MFLIASLLSFPGGIGQSCNFRYKDYFKKNSLFLKTPYVLITAAMEKSKLGETAGAIRFLNESATKGGYNTTLFTCYPETRFITKPRSKGVRAKMSYAPIPVSCWCRHSS